MSKRAVNTPRDGVRSHCIAIDQLYIPEENVYLTFAHCYYQNLLLTPSVGIFYHNVLISLCYNGGCGKLRALYLLLILLPVSVWKGLWLGLISTNAWGSYSYTGPLFKLPSER